MEERAWADTIDWDLSFSHQDNVDARRAMYGWKNQSCPSDLGPQRNEWDNNNWARVRMNYVVNFGNLYFGQDDSRANAPPVRGQPPSTNKYLGAPFGPGNDTVAPGKGTPLSKITDGTSQTLMFSEVLVVPEIETGAVGYAGWGGAISDTSTSTGGQLFTAYNPPNTPAPEWIDRHKAPPEIYRSNNIPDPRCPPSGTCTEGATSWWLCHIAARSHHPGGVNVSRCDASLDFVSDSIDLLVWREMASAWGDTEEQREL
jgi:hypothetical protein